MGEEFTTKGKERYLNNDLSKEKEDLQQQRLSGHLRKSCTMQGSTPGEKSSKKKRHQTRSFTQFLWSMGKFKSFDIVSCRAEGKKTDRR